jgi:hypothetical protein
MSTGYDPDRLKAFAEDKLDADKFPQDVHIYRTFECDICGKVPFTLVIEHHTGSKGGDFKGAVLGVCSRCGVAKRLFSYTGDHRQQISAEKARCTCGNESFYTAMCERYEGEQGILGFFDEGVIVGQCAACGKLHAFVYTD